MIYILKFWLTWNVLDLINTCIRVLYVEISEIRLVKILKKYEVVVKFK